MARSQFRQTDRIPAPAPGTLVGIRWTKQKLAAIDKWRASQSASPSRTQAIRRLVELSLTAPAGPSVTTLTFEDDQTEASPNQPAHSRKHRRPRLRLVTRSRRPRR